ncbi:MAG TPA: TonB-dependent receptor [Gemmatimonadales bacterium]|nr:TonB-dependent receptor [Gemmatimonadales bacterium]
MASIRVLGPLLAGFGLLLAAAPIAAQEPAGFIEGTVTDSTGQPVEAAIVLLENTLLRATTDAKGFYRLFPVPVGPQVVKVAAIGFREATRSVQVNDGGKADGSVSLTPTSVELPGIVVTASRAPEEQQESPASVSVISNKELVQRNVTTIDEALPFVPGVTFNNSDIAIRGSTGIANGVGSRVLLLLDGHPVLTGDGGEIDFEEIPLLDLERVEVVKGAYSALYGSNALGGVVNLITSPISETPSTLVRLHFGLYQVPSRYKFTDDALTSGGFGLQHSRQIGGVGVRFFIGRESSDGYTDNNSISRWLLRTKLTSAADATHPWDAYVIFAREIDYDFFGWEESSPVNPFLVDTASKGDNERAHKLLVGGSVTPLVRAHTLFRISPYFNYNTLQNVFKENNNYHDAAKVGGTMQLVITPAEGHTLTFGSDGGYTSITSNFLGGHSLYDGGLFAQYDVRLADPLKLVAGTRVDYHDATGGESETTINPKLGVVVKATEHLSLRGSVGRGYRAPSAIEQFVNTTQFGFLVVPNPSLKGENAWSGELGLTATHGRLWVDGSVFQSNYHDLISPGPAPGPFGTFQFQNIDRARIRGLDLGVRVRPFPSILDLEASYLYLNALDLVTETELPYRSKHTVTGTADFLSGLVGVDVRFRSRPDVVLQYPLDPRSSVTLVDLRLAYRVLGTGLQLKVSNLLQNQYTNIQERVPGAPRNISLTAYRGF